MAVAGGVLSSLGCVFTVKRGAAIFLPFLGIFSWSGFLFFDPLLQEDEESALWREKESRDVLSRAHRTGHYKFALRKHATLAARSWLSFEEQSSSESKVVVASRIVFFFHLK